MKPSVQVWQPLLPCQEGRSHVVISVPCLGHTGLTHQLTRAYPVWPYTSLWNVNLVTKNLTCLLDDTVLGILGGDRRNMSNIMLLLPNTEMAMSVYLENLSCLKEYFFSSNCIRIFVL